MFGARLREAALFPRLGAESRGEKYDSVVSTHDPRPTALTRSRGLAAGAAFAMALAMRIFPLLAILLVGGCPEDDCSCAELDLATRPDLATPGCKSTCEGCAA